MGALVKRVMAAQKGWPVDRIYHVTVMPCYDKKLEASRDDFLVPGEHWLKVHEHRQCRGPCML
jgi:iron only hydrogenase large subunit-like protein